MAINGKRGRLPKVECERVRDVTPTCHKRSYESHGDALKAMHRTAHHNTVKQSQRGRMNVYYCTTCDGWHCRHAPKPKKKG